MAKELTLEEIYSKIKADYDIESLLEPYKQGGTAEIPIERSSGTIIDWLVNKKKFPPEIAGAGLLSVLIELRQGKSFQGDGSWGSKGNELVQYIARRCDDFNRQKLKDVMFKTIAGAKLEVLEEGVFEMVRAALPAPIRWVAPGSWRWLRKRKKEKALKNVTAQRS